MVWEVVGIQLQERFYSLSHPHPRRKEAVEGLCMTETILPGVLGINNGVTDRFGRQTHKGIHRIRWLKAGAQWSRRQEVKLNFGNICLASYISLHAEESCWYLKLSHFLNFIFTHVLFSMNDNEFRYGAFILFFICIPLIPCLPWFPDPCLLQSSS